MRKLSVHGGWNGISRARTLPRARYERLVQGRVDEVAGVVRHQRKAHTQHDFKCLGARVARGEQSIEHIGWDGAALLDHRPREVAERPEPHVVWGTAVSQRVNGRRAHSFLLREKGVE